MCRTLDVSGFKHKDEGCSYEVMVRFANGRLSSVESWFFRWQDGPEISFEPPSLEGARLVCPRCGAEAPIPKQA